MSADALSFPTPDAGPQRITGASAAALCPPESEIDLTVREPARVALTAALGLLDHDVDEAVGHAVSLVRRLT
ncbi:hypothetical protein, partial [Pseudacidovorax intermedius]